MCGFVKILEHVHRFPSVFAKKSNSWKMLPEITIAAQTLIGSNININVSKMRCTLQKDFSNSY